MNLSFFKAQHGLQKPYLWPEFGVWTASLQPPVENYVLSRCSINVVPFTCSGAPRPQSPAPVSLGGRLPAGSPDLPRPGWGPGTLDPESSSSGRDELHPDLSLSPSSPHLRPRPGSSRLAGKVLPAGGPRLTERAGGWCGRRLSQPCHYHGGSLLLSVASGKPGNQVTPLPRVCTCLREWRPWLRC